MDGLSLEGPKIRRAGPADVEEVYALVELCYRGRPHDRAWTSEASMVTGHRTSREEVARVVSGPASLMLIAESDGMMIGCCQLERRPNGDAYFGTFAVHPTFQNLGVGRALLRAAELCAASEWESVRMVMQVISRRLELLAWYARLGYSPTGEHLPFQPRLSTLALVPDLEFTVLARPIGR